MASDSLEWHVMQSQTRRLDLYIDHQVLKVCELHIG